VDDEPDLNFTLKVTLEDGGFKVDSFDEPLIALENLRSSDLLILNIKMPKIYGFKSYVER